MSGYQRRKANAQERKLLGVGKDCKVVEVDLSDPNLAPEYRDGFIKAVKSEVTKLDVLIGSWYRHRGECGDPDCDCGGNWLIERVETMCSHLWFIKQKWGEVIIDNHPYFGRAVREFGNDGAYETLSARRPQ